MKNIHLLPNVMTAFGLTCGLFVIFKTSMIEPGCSSYDSLLMASIVLLVAGVFDVLDGAIARATSGVSEFGGMFDSLSDAITFGVAPSVLMLKALALQPGTNLSMLATAGAMVFTVCGVLRLVRYSVTQMPRKEKIKEAAVKPNFVGLPIPAAAAAAVSVNLFLACDGFTNYLASNRTVHTYLLTGVMFLLGYLMVSRWRFPSLKSFQVRVPNFQLVFVVVVAAVLIFFGLMQHFALVFVSLSWAYIILAISLSLTRLVLGKRVPKLKDYDFVDEDELL